MVISDDVRDLWLFQMMSETYDYFRSCEKLPCTKGQACDIC